MDEAGIQLVEPIRLLVLDLDDTFWNGTLTEGDIKIVPENSALVKELAERGIISSICSKNDYENVKSVLMDLNIWDFFVLPSISWAPKGPRMQSLLETIGLRASTVLFVDDNPSNLEEVRSFVPEVQIAHPRFLPSLLSSPMFNGKADKKLSRLKQYKLLEKRSQEMSVSADTTEFLRASEIRVIIDHDIRGNIERAIELINRTNQLNFTKRRLPEDLDLAKAQLLEILSDYSVQAGLIRVIDRFGDYGYCGLYVERKTVHEGSGLLYYCFSCRTLGMNIETWLYRRLGRPPIVVVGEVLSNIRDEAQAIDWISISAAGLEPKSAEKRLEHGAKLFVRGGCELMAVSHYLRLKRDSLIGEFAFNRDHIQIRIEHSFFLRYAIEGISQKALDAFCRLGFQAEDFRTRIFDGCSSKDVWVFSFWGDAVYFLYRHKLTGLRIPFNAYPAVRVGEDLISAGEPQLDGNFQDHWIVPALHALRDEYEFDGLISEALFNENLQIIFDRIPTAASVFIVGANDSYVTKDGNSLPIEANANLNRWCRQVVAARPGTKFIDAKSFVRTESDMDSTDANHFDRIVYFRIYEEIAKCAFAHTVSAD